MTSCSSVLTRCTYSQCMPHTHISMTFEPTGDMCALLLVGMAHAFRTVRHVQRTVRTAKHTLKELKKVSKVSNISPNAKIWLFLDITILCFTRHCSLILIDFAADFTG